MDWHYSTLNRGENPTPAEEIARLNVQVAQLRAKLLEIAARNGELSHKLVYKEMHIHRTREIVEAVAAVLPFGVIERMLNDGAEPKHLVRDAELTLSVILRAHLLKNETD